MASAVHEPTPVETQADRAIVVRYGGDGMWPTDPQFTLSTALAGDDLATFPDPRRPPRRSR